jgi:hypothetical protein
MKFLATCLIVAATVVANAQLPVPQQLAERGQVVYLNVGYGMKRNVLNRAAAEISKQKIFTLTEDRSKATLILMVREVGLGRRRLSCDDVTGSFSCTEDANLVINLRVQDAATDDVLWENFREVRWTYGGAILDLVKDLHKTVRGASGSPPR